MGLFLGAAKPTDHVNDSPLFHFVEGDYGWQVRLNDTFHGISETLWSFGIGKHVLMFSLSGILTLWLFSARARQARTEVVPGRFGNFIETIMLFLRDQVSRPFMGEAGDKYLPFIWGFFFFIAINNLLGLIPLFDYIGHGGNTATANIGLTAALAGCSFVLYHYLGIKEQGGVGVYVKSLFPHVPLPVYAIIIPVELMAHIVRPCALAIRLCANMFAGHTMMAVILMFTAQAASLGMAGWVPVTGISLVAVFALSFLELLVALIQAFVFTFLSTVFLSMAVHPDH